MGVNKDTRHNQPLVSILVPVYQVGEYVERCARSLFEQTYDNLEYIFINDCSPDNSIQILESVIKDYPDCANKIKILHHEENRGVSAARNTGIKNATGDYLFFMDSDDELPERSIEILLGRAMEDEAIEMVLGNTLIKPIRNPNSWDVDAIRQKLPSSLTSNEDIRYYFFHKRKLIILANNKLLKRSFVIQHHLFFKEGIIMHEDQLWSFFLYKCLTNMRIVYEYTYYYHVHPNSLCSGTSNEKYAKYKGVAIQIILNHLTPTKEKEEMRRYIKNNFLTHRCLGYLHKVPEYKSAFNMYWRKAWKYRCWGLVFDLVLIFVSSFFRNGEGVYKKLKKIKNRLYLLITKQ